MYLVQEVQDQRHAPANRKEHGKDDGGPEQMADQSDDRAGIRLIFRDPVGRERKHGRCRVIKNTTLQENLKKATSLMKPLQPRSTSKFLWQY